MRLVSAVLMILVSGLAHAGFRYAPPTGLHLVSAEVRAIGGEYALLAQAPRSLALDSGAHASTDALVQVDVDPHAGSFAGREVLAGGSAVFGLDALTIGAATGGFFAWAAATGRSGSRSIDGTAFFAPVFGALLFVGLVELVVSPIIAALAVSWASSLHRDDTFRRALGGALIAQVVTGGVVAAGGLVYSALLFVVSPVSTVVQVATLALALALHYVGVPMGASYAVHLNAGNGRSAAGEPPGSAVHPPLPPSEVYAQARPTCAAPVLAIAF